MNSRTFLLVAVAIMGCSREQAATASKLAAKSYNESNRDNIIQNWQAKVAAAPECVRFKDELRVVGSRFDSAANASFHVEMTKVWEAAKAARCAAST